MKIISIDYGDVRTGIAISDAFCKMAFPLCTITEKNRNVLAKKIAELCQEHSVKKVVLGLPINMNGTLGPRSEKAKAFGEILQNEFSLEVVFRDERSTTISSNNIFNELNVRGKKRKENIDSLSACIILQGYLDFLQN